MASSHWKWPKPRHFRCITLLVAAWLQGHTKDMKFCQAEDLLLALWVCP